MARNRNSQNIMHFYTFYMLVQMFYTNKTSQRQCNLTYFEALSMRTFKFSISIYVLLFSDIYITQHVVRSIVSCSTPHIYTNPYAFVGCYFLTVIFATICMCITPLYINILYVHNIHAYISRTWTWTCSK